MAQRSRWLNLRGIVRHGAESVGDHVEDVSVGHLPQAVDVVRRRMPVAAPHDHAVAFAQAVVAGRAVNVEAILPAQDHVLGHRERKLVHRLAVGTFARVERHVVVQMAARHGAFDQRPLGAAVAEEIAGPQRNVFRLVVHVLAAGDTARSQHQHDGADVSDSCAALN